MARTELPRCCDGVMTPIVYGYPSESMFEAADRGDIQLGGCVIGDDMPMYKPRGKARSMENRLYNRVVSSMRMPVEHAIGRLKWWRAMTQWRRPADRFDHGGRAIAVLTSLI
jgi:hypothetical protein